MPTCKPCFSNMLPAGMLALCLFAQPHSGNAETAVLAQVTGFSYHVLFTGAFFDPDQAPEGTRRSHTLDVTVGGEKKWIFVVDKAVSLGRTATELKILKSIFPPQLSFRGKKKSLDYLRNPDIAGKTLIVEGHLYSKERRFQVLRVEPVTNKEEDPQS